MNKKIKVITDKIKEERKQANQELLEVLTDLVNKTDGHLRFSQLLSLYGFVTEHKPIISDKQHLGFVWHNEFYKEPRDLLKRVLNELKRIEE